MLFMFIHLFLCFSFLAPIIMVIHNFDCGASFFFSLVLTDFLCTCFEPIYNSTAPLACFIIFMWKWCSLLQGWCQGITIMLQGHITNLFKLRGARGLTFFRGGSIWQQNPVQSVILGGPKGDWPQSEWGGLKTPVHLWLTPSPPVIPL